MPLFIDIYGLQSNGNAVCTRIQEGCGRDLLLQLRSLMNVNEP